MTNNGGVDSVDWKILAELQNDASITNKELAERVGLATSSCHERVRRLRATGVISGIHAVVDPVAVGRSMQAIIAVQLRPHRRDLVDRFTADVLAMPETLALFNVSGPEDFFLHVAVRDSAHLQRILIDRLATHPEVWHAQTHLIYGKAVTAPLRPDR
ncbi:DNA-binding Lrp family transcriptional regulator [Rhodococcus sp. 27YEA15]|uniref:Lrp/AsnC family transcriptional regulator n=1 Tax=Rhodococcus sp. 27YEA15 TaxID=3156259 RepID=UPI003C7979BF